MMDEFDDANADMEENGSDDEEEDEDEWFGPFLFVYLSFYAYLISVYVVL